MRLFQVYDGCHAARFIMAEDEREAFRLLVSFLDGKDDSPEDEDPEWEVREVPMRTDRQRPDGTKEYCCLGVLAEQLGEFMKMTFQWMSVREQLYRAVAVIPRPDDPVT